MSSLHSAAVRNATSSSKPSRDFESFIALARSAKHFRARCTSSGIQRRTLRNRYWTLVPSPRNLNFGVLLCIRWHISTCSGRLGCIIVNKLSRFLFERRLRSDTDFVRANCVAFRNEDIIHIETDIFFLRKEKNERSCVISTTYTWI